MWRPGSWVYLFSLVLLLIMLVYTFGAAVVVLEAAPEDPGHENRIPMKKANLTLAQKKSTKSLRYSALYT